MDKDFADWYQACGIPPAGDRLSSRWAGIEKFTATLDVGTVLDLVRLFHRLPPKDPQFLNRFHEPFKLADPAFLMSGNDLEVQLLAGSCVAAAILNSTAKNAIVASLAMVSADYGGKRPGALPPFFLRRARQYLLDRSAHLRNVSEAVRITDQELTDILGKLRDAPPSPDPAAAGQVIRTLADGLIRLSRSADAAIRQMNQVQLLRREESDILWWLFAGYSRDLDRPLSEFGAAAACLISAKELVDLLAVLPGPASANAILDCALRCGIGRDPAKTVTVVEAIRQAPTDWLKGWAQGRDAIGLCGDLCPTLLAAQRSIETPGTDAWVASVEQLTNLNVRAEFSLPLLASQAYAEHRLLRAIMRGENGE